MDENRLEEYLEFAKSIAKTSGDIMKKYFLVKENGKEFKFDNTLVTKADREINHLLIEETIKHYPEFGVFGEEEQYNIDLPTKWICDPLDGTGVYARNIPVAVFSLALVSDGTPLLGVVYDPFTDRLYEAIKGKGAKCNGETIHVSDVHLNDRKGAINIELWKDAKYDLSKIYRDLVDNTYTVAIGSVIRSCMCIACGEFSASVFPGTEGHFWDIAASKIIVEEAGGMVTDLFGNEQRYDMNLNGALITNGVCHNEVLTIVKNKLKNLKE